MNANGPTPAEWRSAMGYFPTGVTVVTSWQDGVPVGSTINAFCSVSLEPPMLLICLSEINPLREPIKNSGVFGVNFLSAKGRDLATRFAKEPEIARFSEGDYDVIGNGAPHLHQSPVFVDCLVETRYEAGDHAIVVGRGIRTVQSTAIPPLLYHKGKFPVFEPVG